MTTAHPDSPLADFPRSGDPAHEREESGDFPVVAIGASAGGLEACQKLLDHMAPGAGMAFVLVQHLDPTHESLMVDLLSRHTTMTVRQASDGMRLEPESIFVIPPGVYLSVADGALIVSKPQAQRGARLPFDFLLKALAEDCGARAICVVLSGSGEDGSLGLQAVKAHGGLVIAQAPEEAGSDGMPKSAIATGAVDLVLPVAGIADALARRSRRTTSGSGGRLGSGPTSEAVALPEIIALLRATTDQDFTLYKPGTLQRRIERRMALTSIGTTGMDRYLERLQTDAGERDLLARDLLIHVTSFFRDPKVFDRLAATIVPELVRSRSPDEPIRIWIAGCSTGEETYSLAMLFREQIAAAGDTIKLQVFASDVDPDAIAKAREGLFAKSIKSCVSPERLARFFTEEDQGYRVSPELRQSVVFSVQDLLADPPFSRLDLISCRNLLIYLRPEAQAKAISIFHFALREGGVLLLGSSETVGVPDGRFTVISKPERLYRHARSSQPREFGVTGGAGGGVRALARPPPGQAPASHQATLAELCRRMVIETHAPAAVLINRKHECLYSLGPTDRYLRVAPGDPSHNLLAMARSGTRARLAAAIRRAFDENARTIVPGGRVSRDGQERAFKIDAQPVTIAGETLLLVCFVDETALERERGSPTAAEGEPRVVELERELETARADLQTAVRDLELSNEEQTAINEEALSVNEEYQSTNEELLTSKEELQSLNEELTALNSQLQETLERQRTTSNDLQNILFSTDVATLFLDTALNIRFFTPATRSVFNVIPSDIGRPLADLTSLAADAELLADARTLLQTLTPIEREIEAADGVWYVRRILPYRAQNDGVEGVVITFTDITERKAIAGALEAAKQQAERANLAKSRFLAAASHDLRQPLQTILLLQGLLARKVEGEAERKLVALLEPTLAAMSGMLNALLDINQIDAGTVKANVVDFPIGDLLDRLGEEFDYHAQAQGVVALRVVPCGLSIRSDPALLEQMIRNLLSNAMKYTPRGKVLLGCRRRGDKLSIEVLDTGVGVAEAELQAIFEEYHQVANVARERSRGLGLGLSIVKRLGILLDHRVVVRSRLGEGSMFAVEVTRTPAVPAPVLDRARRVADSQATDPPHHKGEILVVEDDPEVRRLLQLVLVDEGHRATAAEDGDAALALLARGAVRPDVVLVDYNLPNGMNGLELTAKIREKLRPDLPVVVLTGDISTDTLRKVDLLRCIPLHKPVKAEVLSRVIQRLLPEAKAQAPADAPSAPEKTGAAPEQPLIHVVDDDSHVRGSIRLVLEADGLTVEDYPDCEAFLAVYRPGGNACLLIDAYLGGGMDGLDLLRRLREGGDPLPTIMITGEADVHIAVQAMKSGASDFIEKPIGGDELVASIWQVLEKGRDINKLAAAHTSAANQIAKLTSRQHQILDLVLAGQPSKNIAADLGISRRTVENHRASIMRKTGSKSLPGLARLALAAADASRADAPVD